MQLINGLIGNDQVLDKKLYNSNGHRCREISKINLRNYILFAGDNVTLGLEQPKDKTYPYLLSHKLNMDYYNLAIFNGGIDCLKFNLLSWLKKYNKPRFIVVGFEFLNAVMVSNHNYDYLNPADFEQNDVKDFYNYATLSGFFNGRKFLHENLFLKNINVPIYQLRFKDKEYLFTSGVNDVMHDESIFDYETIAEKIFVEYNKINVAARP
jgi:hypothetical protein